MWFPSSLPGRALCLALSVALPACTSAPSSSAQSVVSDAPCEWDGRLDRGQVAVCEVRTLSLDRSDLRLDASPNGGVTVSAWDRPTVEVQARIVSVAPRRSAARRHVDATRIETGSTVRADLPDTHDERGWTSVDYTVRVPRGAALDLDALNGQIDVRGVTGPVTASTVNGRVVLVDVGDRVDAHTVNGRLEVRLAGPGPGRVDVSTVNGSVEVAVPAGYAADVDLRSTMGSIRIRDLDLPASECDTPGLCRSRVRGALRGGGGALSIGTTNGSVLLRRR